MNIDPEDSVARLQGLQADLIAFSEARLPNLERLWTELETSIEDLRTVLDHEPRNEKSRKELEKQTVTIDGQAYALNAEFKQEVIQIADELDLDEIEAARLLLEANGASQDDERPPLLTAIARYHTRNEALLEALRLIVQIASDPDSELEGKDILHQVVQAILQHDPDKPPSSSHFWTKCFQSADRLEQWMKRLRDRLISMSVIGQTQHTLAINILQYQKESLLRQHESFLATMSLLIKMMYSSIEDYRAMARRLSTFDAFDEVAVHYIPALIAFAFATGSTHGQASTRDARGLDLTFADKTSSTRWKMHDFQALANVFWLAEYSARYMDEAPGSPLEGVDLEKEAKSRSDRVIESLRDGAFQLLILVCSKVRPQLWHDPAKTGLVTFLVGETRPDREASITASPYFDELFSLHLQMFIDALITNMPDTIRRLKYEEDDERRNQGPSSAFTEQQHTLHLERFMMLVSYAFSDSAEAALQTFWTDLDGNMYGFLQWASKRQSTPRAAAFCEMFQAIAESEECANAAHRFLMYDATGVANAKLRRGVTLNWSQVFTELSFYADRFRENPGTLTNVHDPSAAVTAEPESALMLECYLRLTTHLCRNSSDAREFVLSHPDFRIHETLFELCKSQIESRFKACAYQTLSSLLTLKTVEISNGMWEALDAWVCGASQSRGAPSKPTQAQGDVAILARLQPIAFGFEESNAFVRFLQALIDLPLEPHSLNDVLPFPEQLGSSYRMSGVDQYIDFVLGSVMSGTLPALEDDQQRWELRCACLDLIRVALSSFNEDLVIFANTTNVNVDEAIATTNLETYVRLHPFARVMEWMFNDAIIMQLFAASHEDPDVLAALPPDSPAVTAVARAIQVVDLILRLQTTYLDIVRPVIKTKSHARSRQVANPTLASFEDAILANLRIVVDLGLYCSTAFEHLTSLSMDLMQRLCVSRKLAGSASAMNEGRSQTGRLVTALQQSEDADRIALSFTTPLELNAREVEGGEDAPGQRIKISILELLDRSLEASSTRPGLAHCLLGFHCKDNAVVITPSSRFSRGRSLFHAIARLYAETATSDLVDQPESLAKMRNRASDVLRKLFRSPVTSEITLSELRESGFNEAVAIAMTPLVPQFGEHIATGADFLSHPLASLFRDMLLERATYFEHEALELRAAASSGTTRLQERVRSTLLGLTRLPSEEEVQNANVFDLFDFFELDIAPPTSLPALNMMRDLDFDVCKKEDADDTETYDLRLVNELLLLRIAELGKRNELSDEARQQECMQEMDFILSFFSATNISQGIKAAQRSTTASWVQLMTVMLSCAGLQDTTRAAFVLRALQVVLPKVDFGLSQEWPEVLPLVRLVHELVHSAGVDTTLSSATGIPLPTDQLTAASRTALNCIVSGMDNVALRACAYQIMARVVSFDDANLHRHARKAIESLGERLLDVMTEDAFSSDAGARASSLAALQSFVQLFSSQKKSFLTRALCRLNFIQIMVDNVRSITLLFAERKSKAELESTIQWINGSLALLLQIATDTEGASAILEAGLFSAIRDSGLFTADPEVGDDSYEALNRFYGLIAGVLRIVGTIVVVKGARNEVVASAGRAFLNDSRSCFLAVMKATKKGAGLNQGVKEALAEVLDGFQVVVWATGWLESEGNKPAVRKGNLTFT